MRSSGIGCARMEWLDNFVDWWESHWRSITCALTIGLVVGFLFGCTPARGAEYLKPDGVPTIFLPDYNKTIAVFAVTSPVGSGLAVLERQASGNYSYCGICMYFVTDLAVQIAYKGGPGPYIEGVLGEVNQILLFQYPPKTGPTPGTTPVEQLNYTLYQGYTLRMVNGQVVLGVK